MFLLTDAKGVKVADLWDSSRGDDVWSRSFSRLFNDWELGEVQMFLNLINNKRTLGNEQDMLFWKGDSDGRYNVKANVNLLEGVTDRKAPYKLIWNYLVPPKVGFFAWEVCWGKILTTEHLKRRGFQLASKCLLCRKA